MEVNAAYSKWIESVKGGEPNVKQAFTAGFTAAMSPEEELSGERSTGEDPELLIGNEEGVDLGEGTGDEPNEFEVESEKQAEKEKSKKTKTKKR